MDSAFIYITGSLVCSSIMMWWFNTNLPVHVIQAARYLGLKRNDDVFWASDTPMEVWTKADLYEWQMRVFPGWLDELSQCPGCLSMHISFWTSLFINILTWRGCESICLFFLAWGGWPVICNIVLAILNKLQKN